MFITISDVLSMEGFEEVEVLAGEAGLSRRVENVYFMEVPDIYAYIDQNELLLTRLPMTMSNLPSRLVSSSLFMKKSITKTSHHIWWTQSSI
ncbi:hypothetical protein GY31_13595 [Lysinibacillus sphaericus]|nr:hypothetical protein GY31_13595 [Lysinibacillus sphaericus]